MSPTTIKPGYSSRSTFHAVVDVCEYTYSVNLLTQPSGDVTITIGDPSNTDVTAEPAALTFTQDNWDEAQYVTVTCTRDDDAVVDKANVTHSSQRKRLRWIYRSRRSHHSL